MRTTLDLDADILDFARDIAQKGRRPFRVVINEALRLGLDFFRKKAIAVKYETMPHAMGLQKGYSLDNVAEILSRIEGENYK